MKTITIITPANIEVEYKLAGIGARLSAFIIDSLIQFLAILLCIGILFGINRQLVRIGVATSPGAFLAAFLVITFVIYFGYYATFEMLMNGQTIGKRLFGLRVIRDNGQPIEFAQSLIRGLVRITLDMMYVGLFVILFSKKHKRLGDMAAGTIVVIENYNASYEPPLSMQNWDLPDFLPSFSTMTTQEREMVEDWLRRRETLPEQGVDIGVKVAEYFEWKRLNR